MAIEQENLDDDLKLDSIEDLEAEALKELGIVDNEEQPDEKKDEENEENNTEKKDENYDEEDNTEANQKKDEQNDENPEEKNEDKKVEFKPIEVEIAGQKVILKSEDELKTMLSKGIESLSREDKSLDLEQTIIKQGKLTADDLKLLVDAKNGDPKAIAKLAANSKIDILEVDADDADKYVPGFAPVIVSDVEKVAQEIARDAEHATKFTEIAKNLPLDFKEAIMSNAEDLKIFSEHVKTGTAQKIIPEAMKLMLINGMKFADAYVKVGTELLSTDANQQQKKEERVLTEREKELRKKASEQGNGQSNGGKRKLTADDIANMPIEEFEKLTPEDLE